MSLNDGVIAFYTLNDTYGESFGVGPALTPTGSPVFIAGQVGDALATGGYSGAGGSAYATATSSVFNFNGNTRTIAGWFYATSPSSDWGFLSNWANPGGPVQWLFWRSSVGSKITFQIRDGSSVDHVLTRSATELLDQWVFFVLKYDSGTGDFSLQINGETPITGNTPSVTGSVGEFAAGSRNSGAAILKGALDNIGVWNRILSDDEVAEFYNAGAGLELSPPPQTDTNGLHVTWARKDFRTTDEVLSTQVDGETIDATFPSANTTEYRARLRVDPAGANAEVQLTDWAPGNSADFGRTRLIRRSGGTLPTRVRLEIYSRHVFNTELFEAEQHQTWDFNVTFADLADDHSFGNLDPGETSDAYLAPETGSYNFLVNHNMSGGIVEAKINGGSFTTIVADGTATGTLAGVTAGDSIYVRHTQPGGGGLEDMLTITPPTSTVGAFGILVV
jgi:hypothetical protein